MTLQKTPEGRVGKADLSRSTPRAIRGIIPDGRSTRSSGCMTLQIGWLHGGANWQEEQEERVRVALLFRRRRMGGWHKLSRALGMKHYTLWEATKRRRRRPTAGVALHAARLAGVPVEDVLSGAWPDEGTCPHCGRA